MSEYYPADENHYPEHHDEDGQGDQHGHTIVAEFTDGSSIAVVDFDHDGYADLVQLDEDGSGYPEVQITDEFGGEALDTVAVDDNENGYPELILADRNENGEFDLVVVDRDEDGHPDRVFDQHPDVEYKDEEYKYDGERAYGGEFEANPYARS
jgi:hypothetical protein